MKYFIPPWTQGTVGDLLEWAIPTQPAQGQGKAVQAGGHQDGHGPGDGVRRSSRVGRGQRTKYDDYVQIVASATDLNRGICSWRGRGIIGSP